MDIPPSSDKYNHDMEKECISIRPSSLHTSGSLKVVGEDLLVI